VLRQVLRFGFVFVLCGGLIGCGGGGGPDLAEVKGKVTYNGAPVEGARVTFHPTEGPLATGTTNASGEFTLATSGKPGAVIGQHKISVTKTTGGGGEEMSPEDYAKDMAGGDTSFAEESKSQIPAKYADPEKSGLAEEVSSDSSKNDFTFDLTD
jgi:hypothetical protein